MNLRIISTLLATFILIIGAGAKSSTAPLAIPNPVLVFQGQQPLKVKGKEWVRYNFSVENAAEFPNELFKRATTLPPCGKNSASSRTWLDFYDSSGKKLSQLCTLTKAGDLNKISFELENDVMPPSYVYIELTDRETTTKYKSNLADTTL